MKLLRRMPMSGCGIWTGARPGPCRRIALALSITFLGAGEATGCCSDDTGESCMTPDQWRSTSSCPNFPAAPMGQQCPSAEAFAKSCDEKVGPTRIDGDKCCYQITLECI